MRDARSTQLQQALGTALAPLGVTVYEHALTHAGQAYYLIFDVDTSTKARCTRPGRICCLASGRREVMRQCGR